jgi:hypothetical protein
MFKNASKSGLLNENAGMGANPLEAINTLALNFTAFTVSLSWGSCVVDENVSIEIHAKRIAKYVFIGLSGLVFITHTTPWFQKSGHPI